MAETTKHLILLAEDDLAHQELFKEAVADSGIDCDIKTVRDGIELIDYIFARNRFDPAKSNPKPNLIVLDLRMPRMNGLQVLQVLQRTQDSARAPLPPVVVLTSSDMIDDLSNAYRLGAQSCIRKPIDYSVFAEAVKQTLRYWLELNETRHTAREHFAHRLKE